MWMPEFPAALDSISRDDWAAYARAAEKLAAQARAFGVIESAPTAHEVVFSLDKLKLLRFQARRQTSKLTPVLIVYALVNRASILDLSPQTSFISDLLEKGYAVYLIDWGYPDDADTLLGLDDYIDSYLGQCIDFILLEHHQDSVDLLGICQGGVFALLHAALYPSKVRRLVSMVTPIDFHLPEFTLANMLRELDLGLLRRKLGNVPGLLLTQLFLALKPLQLGYLKYLDLLNKPPSSEQLLEFLRMEKWIYDNPDLAGRAAAEFIAWFFQKNQLINDQFELLGEAVSLQQIKAPVLNIYAERDHIVPPASSRALAAKLPASQYREFAVNAGHIGLFVNAASRHQAVAAIDLHLS